MLLCTRSHFINSLEKVLAGLEGPGDEAERKAVGQQMKERIKEYATDETGLSPGSEVWSWKTKIARLQRTASHTAKEHFGPPHQERHAKEEKGVFNKVVAGTAPRKDQRVVYVDGGFDLFSSGHIAFLRRVIQAEEDDARVRGWYTKESQQQRITDSGQDYGPVYVVAGVHDDDVINYWKGINYPIMNIFERSLCVLQCRVSHKWCFQNARSMLTFLMQYIHAIILSAPFTPSKPFLEALPYGLPKAVYHGPTSFMPVTYDPYEAAKEMGLFKQVEAHDFQHVNAGEIVDRILKSRAMYEERQRMKGIKGLGEEAAKKREAMEREAERFKQARAIERQYGV